MLDKPFIGFDHQGRGHKDLRSRGFGFEEHKGFVTHVESQGGHFDRQARYDHHMRLPANHGRPPVYHMAAWDEEDENSDVEFFESSQSHHTNALPHHQQPPHMNFMPPPPVAQPHHNGRGHKDYRSRGFGFEEHKGFVTHVESQGGHFDRQARYDHHMRLPANHGRPPVYHMAAWDEEDEDSDVEFFESSQSHHTNALPHHQQPPHMNFMPPPPVAQPHHNVKMGSEWQGRHDDAYHGGHQIQKHHGGHQMQRHHGMYEMQQDHGGHVMQQIHSGHEMQKHHGMQQQHGGHGMQHQDRLMTPQVPPRHVYMNSPNFSSGDGRAVVVKTTEKWQVSGGHRKLRWGSKGL